MVTQLKISLFSIFPQCKAKMFSHGQEGTNHGENIPD